MAEAFTNFVEKFYGTEIARDLDKFKREEGGTPMTISLLEKGLKKCSTIEEFKETATLLKEMMQHDKDSTLELAYLRGLRFGQNHPKEEVTSVKRSAYALQKDIMIVFDFHDNDFGGFIEDGGNKWCDLYNAALSKCATYEDIPNMLPHYIKEVEWLESIESISQIIANGVVESTFKYRNEPHYSTGAIPSITDLIEQGKHNVEYLNILDKEGYKIGTINEMTKYVLEEYKEQQSQGEGTKLENTWLNGEVLFIEVKNGFAKCWVQ